MKKADRLKKDAELVMNKIRSLTRHIRNVEDNCLLLGERLIEKGEISLGKQLIANGYVHDASKFYGIEFEYLSTGDASKEENAKLKLKLAVQHHNCTNSHHPEFWGDIKNMPRVSVAEMVSDWKARSEEFGTSLKNWIEEDATKRYNFNSNDDVYKEIMEFTDLLCNKPFENITS